MKRSIATLLTGAMISAAALAGGAAWADSKDGPAEIALFQKAPHDIRAAIATAEGATGGKAEEAGGGRRRTPAPGLRGFRPFGSGLQRA